MVRRGVVATLVPATAFGLMPVFAFYAYGTGMSVTTLLILRFAIAAAVFLAWLGLRGRFGRLTGRQWATLAPILSMLEPVVAVVAAWLLLGGTLSGLQLVGGAVVLAGAVWGILAAPVRGTVPAEEETSATGR
ncbi:hypothetical protein SAMN05216276_1002290 [Streptosporangium subroseum]|uniref:EamA-like transporter family protein n=1 Tax=Streptosporangium subroseum TaxID=106412 RepID=A0A239B2X7_9ACTN|nr:hypothetical protein [Streptosporangium subroseum]SNS01594.1 hypothetical protein SAMN05216276_1002290 [Streptosporangium subroseum]